MDLDNRKVKTLEAKRQELEQVQGQTPPDATTEENYPEPSPRASSTTIIIVTMPTPPKQEQQQPRRRSPRNHSSSTSLSIVAGQKKGKKAANGGLGGNKKQDVDIMDAPPLVANTGGMRSFTPPEAAFTASTPLPIPPTEPPTLLPSPEIFIPTSNTSDSATDFEDADMTYVEREPEPSPASIPILIETPQEKYERESAEYNREMERRRDLYGLMGHALGRIGEDYREGRKYRITEATL